MKRISGYKIAVVFLMICVLCAVLPVVCHKPYWAYQKRYVINQIQKHRFPESTTVDSEVFITRGMTSNWCVVTAYITFETNATFREVQRWYKAHPEGIVYAEGGHGLDLLDPEQEDPASIQYRVRYQKWRGALFCPVTPESD